MIDCNLFEQHFDDWKADRLSPDKAAELAHHAESCSYCRLKSRETSRLKSLLVSSPQVEPAPGFEFRLRQRIADAERGQTVVPKQPATLIPRWTALGAGIVAGLAIGIALFLPSNTTNNLMTESSTVHTEMADGGMVVEPVRDSLETFDDTLKGFEEPFDADRHSQAVSSDR